MAERYSFFDAQQGTSGYDRTYSSADIADYFSSFIGNGVYANPANQLKVSAGAGLKASVSIGKAWINGYYYELSEGAKELTIARGDNNYKRYDLVVCSLNLSSRLIEVKVIQGTPAASPAVPSYSRTDSVYDLVLAQIEVPAGTTAMSNSLIKDTRPDKSKCGFVTGVVEQIDTTGLFSQYETEFNTWFDTAKGQLSGDVAGNLSNQIATIQEDMKKAVPISRGGTGATTQSAALAALGGAASGHKHSAADITSGTFPISRGGTGATTAASALSALGVKMGTGAAPATGAAGSIYIQLL